MKILVIKPEETPEEREIDDSLESMQTVVGGLIQAVYPFEDPVALVCNEDGKLQGLPLNRALRDSDGDIYDIVSGTFFVCGIGADSFCSLTDKQVETYKKVFAKPEAFFRLGERIVAVPAI